MQGQGGAPEGTINNKEHLERLSWPRRRIQKIDNVDGRLSPAQLLLGTCSRHVRSKVQGSGGREGGQEGSSSVALSSNKILPSCRLSSRRASSSSPAPFGRKFRSSRYGKQLNPSALMDKKSKGYQRWRKGEKNDSRRKYQC